MLDPARTWNDFNDTYNTITVTTHVVDIDDLYGYLKNQSSTCGEEYLCFTFHVKQRLLKLLSELDTHSHQSHSYRSSTKRQTYSNLRSLTAGNITQLVNSS